MAAGKGLVIAPSLERLSMIASLANRLVPDKQQPKGT